MPESFTKLKKTLSYRFKKLYQWYGKLKTRKKKEKWPEVFPSLNESHFVMWPVSPIRKLSGTSVIELELALSLFLLLRIWKKFRGGISEPRPQEASGLGLILSLLVDHRGTSLLAAERPHGERGPRKSQHQWPLTGAPVPRWAIRWLQLRKSLQGGPTEGPPAKCQQINRLLF